MNELAAKLLTELFEDMVASWAAMADGREAAGNIEGQQTCLRYRDAAAAMLADFESTGDMDTAQARFDAHIEAMNFEWLFMRSAS